MEHQEILTRYQAVLEGTLGAIAAHLICTSKESSRVIRDCSKELDSMSVELRKSLIDFDKQLTIKGENNEQ